MPASRRRVFWTDGSVDFALASGHRSAHTIRIVCANTLGAAPRQSEHGADAQRTFRFRHSGNLQTKFAEARQVLVMTINYEKQFKALADQLAREPIGEPALTGGYHLAFVIRAMQTGRGMPR